MEAILVITGIVVVICYIILFAKVLQIASDLREMKDGFKQRHISLEKINYLHATGASPDELATLIIDMFLTEFANARRAERGSEWLKTCAYNSCAERLEAIGKRDLLPPIEKFTTDRFVH